MDGRLNHRIIYSISPMCENALGNSGLLSNSCIGVFSNQIYYSPHIKYILFLLTTLIKKGVSVTYRDYFSKGHSQLKFKLMDTKNGRNNITTVTYTL